MEYLKKIENIPLINNFKRQLRKKDYLNSTDIAKKTAEFFYDLIGTSIKEKNINTIGELILFVTHLGKIFMAIDTNQFCTGNTIKRILQIIRKASKKEEKKEYDKTQEKIDEKLKDMKKNIQKIRNFEFEELEEKKKSEKKDTNNDDDNKKEDNCEKNSSKKLYEICKQELNIQITEKIKNDILKNVGDLIDEIDNISQSIIDDKDINALISDGDIILTSNYSQQVADILEGNAGSKKFKVLVAESAPRVTKNSQAKILKEKGLDVTIIDDNDCYDVLSKTAKIKVLIGAKAFLVNGGLITYSGAYNLCLAAKTLYIPVIVVGGTTKITPLYSFKHELYNDYLSPDLIYGKNVKYDGDISNIQFNNPAYDYVPPHLITMFATNAGIKYPKCLYELFEEMYGQEDYTI